MTVTWTLKPPSHLPLLYIIEVTLKVKTQDAHAPKKTRLQQRMEQEDTKPYVQKFSRGNNSLQNGRYVTGAQKAEMKKELLSYDYAQPL